MLCAGFREAHYKMLNTKGQIPWSVKITSLSTLQFPKGIWSSWWCTLENTLLVGEILIDIIHFICYYVLFLLLPILLSSMHRSRKKSLSERTA